MLRLSAALNELRSLARQEAEGAKDREAALKGLLASESEVMTDESHLPVRCKNWCHELVSCLKAVMAALEDR